MTDTLERPEVDAGQRKPKRRAGRFRSVLFMVLLVIAGFVATGVLPVREYLDRGASVDAAQAELDALLEENTTLADDIEALYTEQEVERLAREQYGFVRPGETGYVVLPQQTEDAPSEPASPVPTVEEDRSFLQRLWDFVTGSDQPSNG